MDFFIIENGQQVGPLTIAQLAERKITSETLVWREGMADWQPAWKMPELRYILEEHQAEATASTPNGASQQAAAVPPVPPTFQPSDNQQGGADDGNNQQQKKKPHKAKKIWKLLGVVVIIILVMLMATNPSKKSHEEAIKTEVSNVIDKVSSGESDDILTKGLNMMARMFVGNIMDTALDQLLEYHNYLIFSKSSITINGSSHTISYGFCGKVITMNADDMVRALEDDSQADDQGENSVGSDDDESDDDLSASIQKKIEDKTNKAMDKMKDKVKKKVEEKINQKLDEAAKDSSTIDKLIDNIINLF